MAKKIYSYDTEIIRAQDLPVKLTQNGNLGNRLVSALDRPNGMMLLIFEYEIELKPKD